MKEFPVDLAAIAARDAYALTNHVKVDDAIAYLNSKYGDAFTFSQENMLKGKSGGPFFIKSRTAFGFTLVGKGAFYGHAFIIFRGTEYLADILTDLNISVSSSSTGKPVHDGFNKSFKSMELQLISFMSSAEMKNVHSIHCIGHSLGGALATVCGDWIQTTYKRKPYIYSFGCPRVGLYGFASRCTTGVGSERIFRAYHKTDIVPCIPPWPFIHTPNTGTDYYLWSPGMIPMGEYHKMKNYVKSVEDKTWQSITRVNNLEKDENSIMNWLKDSSYVGLTMSSIEWLNQALIFVLKKCMDGVAWLISETFSTSFTLLDQLAYILNKGINLANTVSDWVMYLVKKILQVLGMSDAIVTADLSVQFIRMALQNLHQRVNGYAKDALSKALVDGRAI